mgnify:CR=1 FL=1
MSKFKSYEKINYVTRPAKSVERKVLCEIFRELSAFSSVEDYSYVGFGSTYFADFCLFHKSLNINSMHSIEHDEDNIERFEFNKPFSCIQIHPGESSDVLLDIDLDNRSIIWLDYDGALTFQVLSDLNTVAAEAGSGSVFVISVNAHPGQEGKRLETLKERLTEDKVPKKLKEKDLTRKGFRKALWRIMNNEVAETLSRRNDGVSKEEEFSYSQLFHYIYNDGVDMLTLGGILYKESERCLYEGCKFDKHDFTNPTDTPFIIKVPNLTYKEVKHLDSQMPIEDPSKVDLPGVKLHDIEAYSKIYRFFPKFTEAEI